MNPVLSRRVVQSIWMELLRVVPTPGGRPVELQIEGRHFKVSEAIQNHLEEKLGKLEHYYAGIHRMHAVLTVENNKRQHQQVELICTVAKRQTLVAKGEAEDLYVAIDKAEKKMLAELKKFKAKLQTESRRLPAAKTLAVETPAADGEQETEE
jgi:putative sigma-54 modulation protein